jgi:hypothetical protein
MPPCLAVQRVDGRDINLGRNMMGTTTRALQLSQVLGRGYATRVRAFLRSPGWQCTYSTGRG